MEKKEARVKCNACGTSFKLKVPVTDRPVSFKCKNCGKVLKIRVKAGPKESAPETRPAAPPAAAGNSQPALPGFESTQEDFGAGFDMPDFGADAGLEGTAQSDSRTIEVPPSVSPSQFEPTERIAPAGFETTMQTDEAPGPFAGPTQSMRTPSMEEEPGYATPGAPGGVGDEQVKRWFVLQGDLLKGPFMDAEIHAMIKDGEIGADTSLRMGERPWIKASEIAVFRKHFAQELKSPDHEDLPSISLLDRADVAAAGAPFYTEIPSLVPYPLGKGNFMPLAIFAGIAFVLSAILCLNFSIGLPLNIIGWIILYGYLATLMERSVEAPTGRPPDWDFRDAKNLGIEGAKVFAVLLVFCLLPLAVFMLLMIFFFLHSMAVLGYVFILLTVLVFLGSMFVVPAALVTLAGTRNIGLALNPGKLIACIRKGGQAYTMLGTLSMAAGFACMIVTILSIFLTGIPIAGFIVSALLMAAVYSYGHFIWFHVLGRFSMENPSLTGQTPSPVSA